MIKYWFILDVPLFWWLFCIGALSTGASLPIYVWVRKKKQHIDRIWILGFIVFGFVTMIYAPFAVLNDETRYDIAKDGRTDSAANFLNPDYANMKSSHFSYLIVHSVGKLYPQYEAAYQAHEIRKQSETANAYPIFRAYSDKKSPLEMEAKVKVDGLKQLAEMDRNAVDVAEERLHKQLPVDVLAQRDLYGNSAGLILALELIHVFGDEDLLKGYNISGTGAISATGTTEQIGGLDLKLIAAADAKSDFCFVDASDYPDALKVKEKYSLSLEIKGFGSIDEALQFLRSLPPKAAK